MQDGDYKGDSPTVCEGDNDPPGTWEYYEDDFVVRYTLDGIGPHPKTEQRVALYSYSQRERR